MRFIRNSKRSHKVIFLALSIALAIGMVGSFVIWSSPAGLTGTGSSTENISTDASVVDSLRTDIRRYEQVLKGNPQNLEVWKELGNANYDLGRIYMFERQDQQKGGEYFAHAVEAYRKALELEPENVNVRVDMATAAWYSWQPDLAEEQFQKALEYDDKHLFGLLNYGMFLMYEKQQYAEAIDHWEKILDLNPDINTRQKAQNLIEEAKNQLGSK